MDKGYGRAPVAIVGLGCVLPEAPSPARFWENVLAGRSALRPLAGGPWEWERLGLELPMAARVEGFTPDWRAFRIPPADAAAMNPAQLQVLEAGRQALADVRAVPRERTGIWLGATGLGWQPDTGLRVRLDELTEAVRAAAAESGGGGGAVDGALAEARARLEARLRPASEEPVVNSAASIAAGRIAMLLDLRGPHCAVDAGFASGLAALELAVRALRDLTVDCALLGGASELLSPAEVAAMSRMGVLSAAGARPFDAEAAGTVPGEGAVLLAAKRLDDALRDGDRVHAVVLGVGAACEGGAGSLLAARPGALALAIRRAHADAAVEPGTVGFVECHATGTLQGDAAEVGALRETYGAAGTKVALGSAKPLVGHLRGASGAVGLLRAVLAVERGTIPAQAGFARAHRDLGLDGVLFVPTDALPLRPAGGAPAARAGVSAISLGGLAWHAVVEAHAPSVSRPAAAPAPRRPPEPIAVVGLGGVFPGAPDVPAFWRALLDGHDAVREVPRERWDAARYCDRDPARLERSYTRLGCFVDAPPSAPRWRIPPAAREAVDPSHLLALAAAEQAIEDAGLERGAWDRERTGVFLGFMACQGRKLLAEVRFHFARLAAELQDALEARGVSSEAARSLLSAASSRLEAGLPPLSEDALPGWLGSVAAARVARRFDLRGPQLAVESACASTLAALMAGVQALRDGTCDTVLVGGVWADMQPEFYVGSCRFQALSATGSSPFDARADGFVPGEGAGILVLRRVADAERDGQRIHAVVRAVAGSSDGKGKSVLAPSVEGESLAMSRALEDAGIDPASVDYVECHGTGTALGDRTEVEACVRAYGRGRARPLRVGSVKSNFGHLLAGAAAPALLKTVLAVREGTLPGSLHLQRPNPAIDFGAGPVEVVACRDSWSGPGGGPRRAGVSGFGLGGTNLHAIVEEYRPARCTVTAPDPAPSGGGPRRPPVLPIAAAGGRDAAECLERLGALAARVGGASGPGYLEALRQGQEEAAAAPYRVAVVAADAAALGAKVGLLARGLSGGFDPRVLPRQGIHAAAPAAAGLVAAMFPGQGPQYPNMLRDALAAFPSLGKTLDAADRAYVALCGRPLRPAFFTDDPAAHAQDDEDAHCAVFVVNVALHALLRRHGLAPRALLGQSAGELAALVAAGAMSFEDGLAVVRERTLSVLAISTDDPGRMVALSCGAARAERLVAGVPGYAALAADNGPGACIVSGDRRAVPELLRRAAGEGIEATVLAVSHGYHSELIRAAQPRYLRFLEGLRFRAPEVEVISTVTGRSLDEVPPSRLPRHLASQFVEPVRLAPAIEALHDRGVRLLVECGPKWPLSTFAGQILGDRPHLAQATIHPKVGEVEQLHRALAALFVHGAVTLTAREEESEMAETPRARTPEISLAGPRADGHAPAVPDAMVALLKSVRDLIDAYLRDAGSAGARAELPAPAPRAPVCVEPAEGRTEASATVQTPAPAHTVRPEPVDVRAGSDARPAPTPAAPAPASAEAPHDRVRRLLVEEYVRRTGYPEEMLDPTLDLEADLGIDTVKQVAALAAVRERLGVAPDPAFKLRDANTIAKATAWLAGRLAVPIPEATPRPAVAAAPPSPPAAAPRAAPPATPPARPMFDAGPALDARSGAARPSLDDAREQVRRAVIEELVRRTGYPEEMLDPDLDLEAELGIDTVKQVAVLAAARQRFGLPPDPAFKLRDANTVRKAVEALARRLAGGGPEPRTPPDGPRPPSGGGLPPPSTERGASAQGGASPGGARTSAAGARRLLDALLAAVAQEPIRAVEGIALRVSGEAAPAREPFVDVTPAPEAPGTLRLRAVQGHDVAEATVRTGPPAAAASPAPVEIVRAIAPERRDRAATGAELREALAPILGDADGLVEWARSDGFMVAAGGARLPEGDEGRRIAALLACASEVASFAWVGLTGAPHAVCAVERATFDAVPEAGAELGIHAKMVAPEGGLWRADVTIVSGGARVAEIRGLQGRPVARAAAAGPIEEAANRAWQRFCRRMQGGHADEDVA